MGLFNIKTAVIGLTSIFTASSLFADQVLDETFDDNAHEMEQYWYYYDDNAGTGEDDRPQSAPELAPSVIDVPFTEEERQSIEGDDWMVKDYEVQVDDHAGRACITMPFEMGDAWEVVKSTYSYVADPYCGIGAMLAPEGDSIDLTGVDSIGFWIKTREENVSINFKVQIKDMDDHSGKVLDEPWEGGEFAYHGYGFTTEADEWTYVSVYIGGEDTSEIDVKQPSWVNGEGHEAGVMAFDITQCTKLAWEVSADEGTVDTLDIADVRLIGDYEFVSPTLWTETESTAPSGNCKFADFENTPYNESPLGTYWYAYNDAEIGGTSNVLEDYATLNPETGLLNLKFEEGNGVDEGRAPALAYELGVPVDQEGTTVQGFVGIGCNLYDSLSATYWDAEAAGATGVYFEYQTAGNDKYLVLELSDINDVGDVDDPDRRDSRGSGIVYYRNLPPTEGEWRKVFIPFDELIVHSDWEGYVDIPLDLTKLAKIQWKVQGAEETQGAFAIDNIAFPEVNEESWGALSVLMNRSNAMKAAGFDAMFNNGNIQVKLNNPAYTSGTVDLVNVKGAVVRSASIARGADFATLSAKNLSAGMYLVNLRAVDAKGNAIRKQTRINILQ